MDRERIQAEIEQDRQALEPVLTGLLSGVSRPDALSAGALFERMEEASIPRRPLRWRRMLAAAAAFILCFGGLLAWRRQAGGSSLTAAGGAEAAPQAAAYTADVDGAYPEEGAPEAEAEIRSAKRGIGEADGESLKTEAQDSARPEMALAACSPMDTGGIAEAEVRDAVESDWLAQDEKYFYYLSSSAEEWEETTLYILETEDLEIVSSTPAQAGAQGLLLSGDRLAVLSREAGALDAEQPGEVIRADIYNVQDRSAPSLERTIRQDGEWVLGALVPAGLCLVSAGWAEETVLPRVQDSLSEGDGALFQERPLPEGAGRSVWTVVTMVNLEEEASSPASLAVFGGTDSLLLWGERIYLASGHGGASEESTVLSLSLADGVPRREAAATVQGGAGGLSPLEDGLLLVTNDGKTARFYRLDEQLEQKTLEEPRLG